MTAGLELPRTQKGAGDAVEPQRGTAARLSIALRPGVLALLSYLILATAMLWRSLSSGGTIAAGLHGDPSIFIWSMEWVPFALQHHLDPFVTTYQNFPAGANLLWNTSILLPAFLLAPITALFGPIESYNVLSVLAIALTSWCGYLACHRYTKRALPAWVGGLLLGFSPYMYLQSLGHLHTSIALLPPLLLLLGDELFVRQRRRPLTLGVLIGVLFAAQLLTGEELLAMSAIMGLLAVLIVAALHRNEIRSRLAYVARASGWAAVAFALLAAVPLYVQFFGPQVVHGVLQPHDVYVARLEAFVLPTGNQLIGLPSRTATPDSDAFIGIPLIVLTLIAVAVLRKRRIVLASGILVVIVMVLSLGGHLRTTTGLTRIPLPWLVVNHIPVFDNIIPIRLMLFAYLGIAVILAVFVDTALNSTRARVRIAGCAVTVAALVPLIPTLPFPQSRWDTPAFFTDGSVNRIPEGSSVLMSPLTAPDARVWQANAALHFRTPLSWTFTPRPYGTNFGNLDEPLSAELFRLAELNDPVPVISPSDRTAYVAYLQDHRVQTVVVGPSVGHDHAVAFLTQLLLSPPVRTGGVDVWFMVDPAKLS